MQVDPWILTFSAATVLITIWMGFWSAKKSKTASDFFVAGRSVSVGWNASAISGEYLSAASFMGVAGMVMSSGYDALWYPVCYACGYLFLLLFIAGPLRRFGAYTIPDFAEGRFDSPLFRKIAVVFVLFIGFFYTMPQMKGAGTTLAYIFQDVDLRDGWFEFLAPHNSKGEALKGFPYWAGVLIVGAVITLNVALGGMKGITLVQAFQYWLKMFAISVPIFVLMTVYGHYGDHLRIQAAPVSSQAAPEFRFQGVGPVNEPPQGFARLLAWAGEKAAEIRSRLSGAPMLAAHFSSADLETHILPAYAALVDHVVLRPDLPLPTGKVSLPNSAFASRSQAIDAIETNLLALGLAVLRVNRDLSIICPVAQTNDLQRFLDRNQVAEVRQALPAKAPPDETWLNPFGPLTTKAASAAQSARTRDGEIVPVNTKPYALLYTYSLIIALVCGTAGLPHILVRFYTNPDGVAAKRTTMWVMILIGVFYLFPPVFGVMGRNLLPELYAASGAKGTDKVVLELPRVLDSPPPAYSLTHSRKRVSEKVGEPVSEKARFPWGSILSGITCAGAFAAFMSTFSGLLVSMTGAMAHDVYGRMLNPKATPRQRLRAFKIAAVGIGAVAILLGMQVEPLQINFMVGQAFAIAAASYFPLLFMSAWWRGMTMKGAATGMLTGGIAAVSAVTLTNFSDLGWFKLGDFWASHPLARILFEQPAIWTVPLAIGLMVIVSKLTGKEVPSDIRMKMLVLHAPEKLGLKQEYIQEHQEHQPGH